MKRENSRIARMFSRTRLALSLSLYIYLSLPPSLSLALSLYISISLPHSLSLSLSCRQPACFRGQDTARTSPRKLTTKIDPSPPKLTTKYTPTTVDQTGRAFRVGGDFRGPQLGRGQGLPVQSTNFISLDGSGILRVSEQVPSMNQIESNEQDQISHRNMTESGSI